MVFPERGFGLGRGFIVQTLETHYMRSFGACWKNDAHQDREREGNFEQRKLGEDVAFHAENVDLWQLKP